MQVTFTVTSGVESIDDGFYSRARRNSGSHRHSLALRRKARRGAVAGNRCGPRPAARHGGDLPYGRASQGGVFKAERRAPRARAGDAGRDRPGIRLPRRRPGAVHGDRCRSNFRARLQGAADRPRDERPERAALLLARPAGDRARAFDRAGKTHAGGRCGGALHGREHLRRHGGGAALRAAVSPARGALFAIIVGGMASIAGTVLFLYAAILRAVISYAVAHLLIASILSAPAALVIAFLMVPPEGAVTGGNVELRSEASSSMDALTRGTLDGAQLLLNIVAMLVVFVALVALVNLVIAPYSLQGALGWALAPLAWLCGIPWSEARAAGALLGTKTVINELVAYVDLSKMTELSERSRVLLTYALCGFANFGSLGIMIGGLGTMCPERRAEVVALGLKSIVAGTLATCLTAATVALLI